MLLRVLHGRHGLPAGILDDFAGIFHATAQRRDAGLKALVDGGQANELLAEGRGVAQAEQQRVVVAVDLHVADRLFVLLRFAGEDVAALIEQEGPQASAYAMTNGACVRLALSVDHGRVLALCPSVADYECELAVVVLPFLDGSSIDVGFAYGGHKVGSIRLDSRVAKLESKINYKAKPALCALIRDAQRGVCRGCFEIDAVCYLPADVGAVLRYEVAWAGDPLCLLGCKYSIRI